MYQEKTMICKECGKEFPFTAGEQEFYEEKGSITRQNGARTAAGWGNVR